MCTSYMFVLGRGLGVNGGWPPLPTRPQRYCDPASLVVLTRSLDLSHVRQHFQKMSGRQTDKQSFFKDKDETTVHSSNDDDL